MAKEKLPTKAQFERLLGLIEKQTETDPVSLLDGTKKKYFETVIVFGKIRVLVDSFEAWYANQTWYKKVDGTPPGQNLTHTISIQEAADALGVRTSTVYELLKRYPITVYQIGRHRRIDKVSFEKWRAENPRYRPQNEGSDCIGSE